MEVGDEDRQDKRDKHPDARDRDIVHPPSDSLKDICYCLSRTGYSNWMSHIRNPITQRRGTPISIT